MSVHSFVLVCPAFRGIVPPTLPWADEIGPGPESRKIARWMRFDTHAHGDGSPMPVNLYTLVTSGRGAQGVIDAFHEWCRANAGELELGEAVLLVTRAQSNGSEVYSSHGSPRLLASARRVLS